jgi:hypothetical protein
MGWKRTLRYAQLRLIRIKDTTRAIATGLAFGAGISFVPLPGTHIITAIILTMLVRGNKLAALAGTLVGNPWTFPFMWWAAYKIGDKVFQMFGVPVLQMPAHFSWDDFVYEITAHPAELMLPWASGGIILMAFSWPVFYILSYRMVQNIRRKHRR